MSAFKQKLARLGATAGVLAASTAAIFAVGGATAGSAIAAPPNCVTGAGIVLQGEGSTLQGVAQEKWTSAYNTDCPTASKINFAYTGTGSGAALEAFGYTTGGGTVKTAEAYVGTDEAPEASQITAVHTAHTAVNPVIVPVAQTSIAVIAHLPSGCKIEGGITYKDLNKLFAGKIKEWSELETDNGNAACNDAITRVVREDGSGTTFQFKNYLSVLETTLSGTGPGQVETSATSHVCETENWSAIRKNGGTPNLNLAWPETFNAVTGKGCSGNGTLSPVTRAHGGGGVVNAVKNTENTIGYAAYSDVVANSAIADAQPLENLNSEGVFYGAPGTGTESKKANCEGRVYTAPEHASTGLEVDWSKVFGAKPGVGAEGEFYPLCTLTFDLSWHGAEAGTSGYQKLGYSGGSTTGTAVEDYLRNYVLETSLGQNVLNTNGYETLPSNILPDAKIAAEKIN